MISNYDPKQIEENILKFWKKEKIYEKAKDKNKKGKDFYFLDGPPYTSGRIHIGQAWNKSLKDSVLRYKRMQGFNVWDRAGYDMHGLPTAHKVEAKFKIKSKEEIPKFGIKRFVEECRKLALENMHYMNKDFKRLGVWMDFENAYKPINQSFMEGEWWLIKKAHEKKRLYEGLKSMHWCPDCATALAKHELEYKNITDESIFLKFRLRDKENEFFIIWTTTPWTIAFNLGIMVNPELEYVKMRVDNEYWYVAKALANVFISSVMGEKLDIVEEIKGEKLHGIKYIHPFHEELSEIHNSLKSDKIFTILLSKEYVDTSAGTGLVHCAPGCGPEDFEVGHKYGIKPFNELDEQGFYKDTMGKFSGWHAKKDDKKFTEELDKKGVLLAKSPVEHEYAHCWRCKSPVVFKTTKQWFFKVEDLKEKLRELNKKVYWIPGWAGSNWFDSWLDNLRDNGITRQRYWGTPLPIWRCECGKYDVIGSIKELKEKAGKVPKDLHKPYIDEIKIPCECGNTKKRIPDILDVWIDAGTTSWTCLDYPQRDDFFKKLWPAEFILEGKDQIRGWFNLLLVASMVSIGKHSYKACYMHGFIQDAQGRKMSKSLGNIISPYESIDKFGADTLRYYIIGGANPGLDINYNFEDMKLKHKNLIILWNLHKFLIDYSENIGVNPTKLAKGKLAIEEKYILSKLHSTIEKTTRLFEEYKLNEVPIVIEDLFLELSRTYLQLTRDKSSIGSKQDKETVLYTLYNVLIETIKLLAPITPFITEKIFQNLADEFGLKEESIHFCDWPKPDLKVINSDLEENMAIVNNVVQAALAGREKIGMGMRWPLKEILVTTSKKEIANVMGKLDDIIKTQINVKSVSVKKDLPGVGMDIKPDYKQMGPDFGKDAPKIIAKLATESTESILNHIEKEGKFEIRIDNQKFAIVKEHLIVQRKVPEPYQEVEFKGGFVYLDKELDDELEAEGYSRELMRRVQSLRKKAGLRKLDRISLFVNADEELSEMLKKWEKQIKEKVGASKLKISELGPNKKHKFSSKEKVKGKKFELFFDKV